LIINLIYTIQGIQGGNLVEFERSSPGNQVSYIRAPSLNWKLLLNSNSSLVFSVLLPAPDDSQKQCKAVQDSPGLSQVIQGGPEQFRAV